MRKNAVGLGRSRPLGRAASAALLALGIATVAPGMRQARACSPSLPTTSTTTVPRPGATEVPTASSFVIASASPPVDLTLEAGGAAVPLGPVTGLGQGRNSDGAFVTFWRVGAASGFLPASSDLVLSAAGTQGGPRVVLTSVKTAAGYDKQHGTPATLESLKLTRVRYPREEIASGNCVFEEYGGYIAFESDAATTPGTPADSIVNTIVLRPRYGGAPEQSLTWDGSSAYAGDPPDATLHPQGGWMPYLDPTLEYCATITSFGYGDIARLPLTSNTLCATVVEVSSSGGTVDAGTKAASSGCAVAGGSSTARPLGLLVALGLVLSVRRRVSGGRSARRS